MEIHLYSASVRSPNSSHWLLSYLSRQPLSLAKRWKAPMGSDPVLRMKISGVEDDMSL